MKASVKTSNNNQFGINASVEVQENGETSIIFFKPGAMHELMVQKIVGSATKEAVNFAKDIVADHFKIERRKVL